MVYAYRSYNDNRPYKREEDNSALSVLMRRFSRETSYSNVNSAESFMDKSVQNLALNSIIEGNFPKENVVRQMAIKRVNKILCVLISLLIAVVVVSYYFVITCEMKLNDISRETVILNNENADLQNKLDSLKSFSNVDKTFQQNNMLKRAGQVIEIPEINVDTTDVTTKKGKKKIFKYAIGF